METKTINISNVRRVLSFDIGIRNLSFCLLECSIEESNLLWKNVEVKEWQIIDLLGENSGAEKKTSKKRKKTDGEEKDDAEKIKKAKKKKNAKTISIHEASQKLRDVLLGCSHLLQQPIHYIIIEQQPLRGFGQGSSRMKIMQHAILDFYELFYLWNRVDYEKPKILATSPSNKLKCIIDPTTVFVKPVAKMGKMEYKQRKTMAVELCQKALQFIKPLKTEYSDLLQNRKKLDDLCDSFMQAIYIIQTEEMPKYVVKAKKSRKKAKTE